ncbi:MAG: hypothetical protein JWP47_1426 [Polaromonas sp.]|nr:hypothetical protein [Polaromonas sp.]
MRLLELHLKAFGPFTDHVLPLGSGSQRLVLVHGLNEAGKSSALRAIAGLRFGIDTRSPDRFVHDYAQMRVGGMFADAQGQIYSLMRRKGTGVTLKYADFSSGAQELAEPVPPAIARLLTAGLTLADYQGMFGLDHQTLRKGGAALAKGEGEIGAALFEASSGAADVQKILAELDASAKKFFMPAAHAKNARINQALADYKAQADIYRQAQVRPAAWEAADRASRDAGEALGAAKNKWQQLGHELALVRELIAVSPLLAAMAHAEASLDSLADQPLLAESATAERAAAEAGLSDAAADAALHEAAGQAQQAAMAQLQLDPAIIGVGPAVSRLQASAGAVAQLLAHIASTAADVISRRHTLESLARRLDPAVTLQSLLDSAPSAIVRARITDSMAALEQCEHALLQHRAVEPPRPAVNAGLAHTAGAEGLARSRSPHARQPDPAAEANLRITLAEAAKSEGRLTALTSLPAEISRVRRAVASKLAEAGLADEASARRVRLLIGAAIDDWARQQTALASEYLEKQRRIADTQQALQQQEYAVADLLAGGHVPTHAEVEDARRHRQAGWALVRASYIDELKPAALELDAFAAGQPLAQRYEQAVKAADRLVDSLARDTGRVAQLEAAQRQRDHLTRELQRHQQDITRIAALQQDLQVQWSQVLDNAGIPVMPPGQLRDWQALVASAVALLDDLQAKGDALEDARAAERDLTARLRQAVQQPGMGSVDESTPLATLLAIAEDATRQAVQRAHDEARLAGEAVQLQRQRESHHARTLELTTRQTAAAARFADSLAGLRLPPDASPPMAKARLGEFAALVAAQEALEQAQAQGVMQAASLSLHQELAAAVALALAEPAPADLLIASERWSARLAVAQEQQARLALLGQQVAATGQALAASQAKLRHHKATLERLCSAAEVADNAGLPDAEEKSRCKRQSQRDLASAGLQLAQASSRRRDALQQLLAGRDPQALRAEESRLAQALEDATEAVEQARGLDEAARLELAQLAAPNNAAAAAEAMSSAAATVRDALPLYRRTRLGHALLQEAVRRFKERSQAPMLRSASAYFSQMTDGEFSGLVNDDAHDQPVIAARRPGGALVGVEALSEGTRDQLYLSLRLAALQLQRERGVDLPVILDDVLMTSDDGRAGCILQALCAFARGSQVIVFTHHQHVTALARQCLPPDDVAIVELKRQH